MLNSSRIEPDLSLVVATKERVESLGRLCESLVNQESQRFELIVVDQNPDERLGSLEAHYAKQLTLTRLRSTPGASLARNMGLQEARAQLICFPDDDCWYPPHLVKRVVQLMAQRPELDGICGKAFDPSAKSDIYRFEQGACNVTASTLGTTVCAPGLFLRKRLVRKVGGFNVLMGPGANSIFGGMEEHDLILRMLAEGAMLEFDPNLVVYHPRAPSNLDVSKVRRYACGMGRINALYPDVRPGLIQGLAKSLCGLVLDMIMIRRAKLPVHWQALAGRWEGYWRTTRDCPRRR